MSKQNFCLRKAYFNSLVFVLSLSFILLFTYFVMLPSVISSTHAEGDNSEDGVTIVVSPEINAALFSSEKGDYRIVEDIVTVSTDAPNGYTLYVSAGTTEHQTLYLNGDPASEDRINGANGTYESPKSLGDYEWGFAVPGISHFDNVYDTNNPDVASKFAILPTENKIIRDCATSAQEDATEIYYGFRLGGIIEPGAYKTEITYTATPAVAPLKAKAILGDDNNLNFLYDRKTYAAGETYEDNLGETTITNVYSVPLGGISTTSTWPWTKQKDSIFTANFDDSFINARPTSMAKWFRDLDQLGAITNHRNLNTSMVQTMYQAFVYTGRNVASFDFDLSGWNTSNVVNMSFVFSGAGEYSTTFSLNIDGWDTSSATSFYAMFYRAGFSATSWNIGDLSGWNTGNVTDFYSMFNRAGNSASAFDIGNLDDWNTDSAVNMSAMFGQAGSSATVWNIGDLSGWNTSNVTNLSWIFNQAGRDAEVWNIGDISGWNTGNVTDMSYMFPSSGKSAASWNVGDLGGWDTSKVTNMRSMFEWAGENATSWNAGDLSGWSTGNVTDMGYMFREAGYSDAAWSVGDLSGWSTGNVTDMEKMFHKSGYAADTWDVGNLNYVDEENQGWNIDNVTNHEDFVDWTQANIDFSKLPWQSN